MAARVMIMAGGTGGHVFPALAVAEELRLRGMDVFWLGVKDGFEARVVPESGFRMEWITIRGLRGNGMLNWLAAPFLIVLAMLQVLGVVIRNRPKLVLGMGGFVTGPGGVVARLLGIPLVIHEQNAVAGMTNRWLARIANRVLEAFPGSFGEGSRARVTGNPVRTAIVALPMPETRMAGRKGPVRLLVLGGSQGAQVLNETVPAALAGVAPEIRPEVLHQAGREKVEQTVAAYDSAGVSARVQPFVSDMAEAYGWADLVICRSGALTVSELAAAGAGSLLVPYPSAVDDHQTKNASYLSAGGAAQLIPQADLDMERLASILRELIPDRSRLGAMAVAARRLACPEATADVVSVCEGVIAR